ncbi:btk-binding protein-related [Anaeramoeba ignava]|uniref:Btk-binding protein-related n=1 Tax=Anaeramoeba ignava TaxID=1746090 RepID=A0A9Q0L7I8_ANAIG|nr:btk-binding protein-related [Anaeramoeba ignava]
MGTSHSVMLVEDEFPNKYSKRKLYSCGFWQYNGLGDTKNTKEFTEIPFFFEHDDILEISVGYEHNLILTSNGKLFGFGNTQFGRLADTSTSNHLIPFQIEIPGFSIYDEDVFKCHIHCGASNSFLFLVYFNNFEKDLIHLFRRKEFCDISFKTKNGEVIEAHQLILQNRLNQNQIEKLRKIISNKSIKESNQIFEMIYSNRIINTKLYSEIKEIIKEEKLSESMRRLFEDETTKDFIIERNGKSIKFHKLILIMRSELYRGMFLLVTDDKSNKVTDYSEISDEAFQIFEYWIYSNQIKKEIQLTKEIIYEIEKSVDYFQLNPIKPNLLDFALQEFKKQTKNQN